MTGQLIGYIQQQLAAGYTLEQIKGSLLSYNYDHADVEADINSVIEQEAEGLHAYIQQQLDGGYPLPQIRQSLVQSNYDYRVVDKAIKNFSHLGFEDFFKKKLEMFKQKNSQPQAQQNLQEQTQQQSNTQTYQQNFQQPAQEPSSQNFQQQQQNSQTQAQEQYLDQYKNYVRQLLNQGYSLENIQSTLLNQGYDPNTVNNVINSFRQSHFHIPKTFALSFVVLAVVSIFIGLISTGNLEFSSDDERTSPRVMDLEVEDLELSDTISPGDEYRFKVTGINMGKQKGYDVFYTYYLKDSSGKKYNEKTESKILDNTFSEIFDISIPDDIEDGSYKVWVEADYGSDTAKASITITIGEISDEDVEPSLEDKEDKDEVLEETEVDEGDAEKQPELAEKEDFEENQEDDVNIPSGTDEQETEDEKFVEWKQELSEQAKLNIESQAKDDPEFAAFNCEKMGSVSSQDACMRLVAETAEDYEYCSEIQSVDSKDNCYIHFASRSTDRKMCDNIEDARDKKVCVMLTKANNYKDIYGITTREDLMDYLEKTQTDDNNQTQVMDDS